jgi:aryl-alcohol dehydrogenase
MMPRNFGGLRMDGTSALSRDGQRIFGHFFGQSSFAQYAIASERTAVKVSRDSSRNSSAKSPPAA